MIRKQFTVQINAPKEKVWKALWEDKNYRDWTSIFTPGSYAESEWKEGSTIKFLSPSGSGLLSVIDKLIPGEYMAFKHLKAIKDGVEQPETEDMKEWVGAMEIYTLKQNGSATDLIVDLDVAEKEQDYFAESFPKALAGVKRIAETL